MISNKAHSLEIAVKELHERLENIKSGKLDTEYLNDTVNLIEDLRHDMKKFTKIVEEKIKYEE